MTTDDSAAEQPMSDGPSPAESITTAFESEAVPHIPALYRTALRLTHQRQAAEDLVQDTLERAFRAFHRYEPGTNMRAWLFKIMSYLSISAYRHQKRVPRISSLDDTEEWSLYSQALKAGLQPADVESTVLARLGESNIQDAIDQLTPELRLVVMLADVEEFTYNEIAEIMGTPRGTVMSRLHRGRRRLQRALWQQAETSGILPQVVSA